MQCSFDVPQVNCEWVEREKDQEVGTCETLVKLADEVHTDLLVVGAFGRKGAKLSVLGSVSDHSLREGRCSICVVKPQAGPMPGKKSTFMLATDGSFSAGLAFVILLNRLRQPNDRIVVVSVKREDLDDGSLEPYRELLKEHKVGRRLLD